MIFLSNLSREIDSEVIKINTFIEERLAKDKVLIPTFQREFVWQPENILKLWDSIFRFYPIGSILYWITDTYLNTHRKLGGFNFPHNENSVKKFKGWSYILDGQQRATSLLVSLLGGKGQVKDDENFDYTVYFDATKGDFFFANDLENRKKSVNPHFLIKLKDVPQWNFSFFSKISNQPDFNKTVEHNISQLQKVFADYRMVLIKIQGVDVEEVCEIFERVNQEGKKLDPVDIIIARTYRNEDPKNNIKMFYLRDNLKDLREELESKSNQFQELDDLAIIQMVSICLRKEKGKSFGITPSALDNLTSEVLEKNLNECRKTIFETLKFLSDLSIYGPEMLPYRYLLFPLCYYFHKNKNPRKEIASQWFWATAFSLDDFRRADQVYTYCKDFFDMLDQNKDIIIPEVFISKSKLIKSSYRYRSALTRTVLAFLANQNPLDFSEHKAPVLDNVYFIISQVPNLHHIYPREFLKKIKELPKKFPIDSLMNICYLRAKTNIQISNQNPLEYFGEIKGRNHFEQILHSHLIPKKFIIKKEFAPEDYKDFLNTRSEIFCKKLMETLPDVKVTIIE